MDDYILEQAVEIIDSLKPLIPEGMASLDDVDGVAVLTIRAI